MMREYLQKEEKWMQNESAADVFISRFCRIIVINSIKLKMMVRTKFHLIYNYKN